MPYPQVDAGDYTFSAYADLDAAEAYLGGAFHNTSWVALDDLTDGDDIKGKALVTATRLLDRQLWLGEKTDPAQELQWPRTNTGVDGVVDATVPTNIVNASIEIALALVDGSDLQNQQSAVERIRSMQAGSVSISNFRGVDIPTRFPQIVHELVAPYLGGPTADFAAKATGVSGETIFPIDLGFNPGGI